MGAATSHPDLFNGSTAPRTGGALLAKDLEVVGEVAILTAGIDKVLKGGATNGDRFTHDVAGGCTERRRFLLSYSVRPTGRANLCSPQCFIDIDIAESSDKGLVEERGFDGCFSLAELFGEPVTVKIGVDRFRTKTSARFLGRSVVNDLRVAKESHIVEV